MELKGSKTEKNLMEAFAGNHRLVISILIMPPKPKKKAITLLQTNSNKPPIMKKNMLKFGLNFFMAEKCLQLSIT